MVAQNFDQTPPMVKIQSFNQTGQIILVQPFDNLADMDFVVFVQSDNDGINHLLTDAVLNLLTLFLRVNFLCFLTLEPGKRFFAFFFIFPPLIERLTLNRCLNASAFLTCRWQNPCC